MPELPEVETVRQTLRKTILNAKITKVSVIYDKIIKGNPDDFIMKTSGKTICEIDRVGKYLIFVLDDIAFVSHLRMEGKYNILGVGAEIGKHEHIIFHLADGRELRYHDTRKFGRMELKSRDNYKNEPPLSKLGPEPFTADADLLYKRLKKSRLPIKSLLLDQTILNGIGNIYANEICYQLRINPHVPGNQITEEKTKELIAVASRILIEAIALGGTTIHSFTTGGVSGRFQTKLKVHGKKECPACLKPVIKAQIGGRGTYYCESCQSAESEEINHAKKQ
ncbi:MAG: DNA-formamidopyrimidine glycosylase [Lachnospiraceae bacterium]|nr:DNA-formamidopyrimidine glycosylase [Lachnospiraceae bacterium]